MLRMLIPCRNALSPHSDCFSSNGRAQALRADGITAIASIVTRSSMEIKGWFAMTHSTNAIMATTRVALSSASIVVSCCERSESRKMMSEARLMDAVTQLTGPPSLVN